MPGVRLLPDLGELIVKKRYPHFIVMAMGLLLCLCDVTLSQVKAPDPRVVLKEMVSRYAGLSSYQDTGVIQMLPGESLLAGSSAHARFVNVSSGGEILVSFKTYFARPRMLRFEWKSSHMPTSREAAIWSDGRTDFSWLPNRGLKDGSFTLDDGADLRFNVGEAQRLSGGAVFFVPSLLIKDLDYVPFGEMVSSMTDLSLVKDEQVDGELCHVISGKIYGTPWVLWVGKDSRLLRKTRTLYTSASFHETLEKKGRVKLSIAEEVHRDIKVNEKIPEAVFRYRPQLRADDIDLTR
jgi:hypothetical protein